MFKQIEYIEGYLEHLKLHKVLFAYEENFAGGELGCEEYYLEANETLVNLANDYAFLENTESTLLQFYPSELKEFYELCREDSRRKKINFKKNPHVKEAEKEVYNCLCNVGFRRADFTWNLWVPKKLIKKRHYAFIIELGSYFEDYTEMLEAVYCVLEYYKQAKEKLYNELYPKIVKMPKRTRKERKKAA